MAEDVKKLFKSLEKEVPTESRRLVVIGSEVVHVIKYDKNKGFVDNSGFGYNLENVIVCYEDEFIQNLT